MTVGDRKPASGRTRGTPSSPPPPGLIIVDAGGRIQFVDDHVATWLEIDPDDVLGRPLDAIDAFDQDLLKPIGDAISSVSTRGADAQTVVQGTADPPGDPLSIRAQPLPAQAGQLVLLRVARAGEEPPPSSKKTPLAELLDGLGIGVCRSTPDGDILEANQALADILGYPSAEALQAEYIGDLYQDPSDRSRVLDRLAEEGSVAGSVIPVERRDGSTAWTRLYARAERDDGTLHSISCVIEDITEERHAKKALAESELRYRRLVEVCPLGIALHQAGRVVFVNPTACELLGADASSEVVGQPVTRFVHPDERERARRRIQRIYDGEDLDATTYRLLRLDGSAFPARVEAAQVTFDGMTASQLVIQDITDQKAQEAEREAWLAKLERSNEELEQFAHVVSHDLREPLRMIHQYACVLEDQIASPSQPAQLALRHILDGSKRAIEMLDGLLRYSRVSTEAPQFEQVDLQTVVHAAQHNLDVLIDDADARVEVDPLPTVEGHAAQLVQLFQNLIENAIRYRGDEVPHVRVHTVPDDHDIHVVVEDNGVGIPPDQVEEIFTPFEQLEPGSIEGMGLGLTICRRIVDRHRGEVWATSEPGAGTEIHVRLPREHRPEQPAIPGEA